MAQASASIDIPVSPDRIWQLIGGFGSLPDWLPYITKRELSEGGRVRHLANPNGESIVEQLERFDNEGTDIQLLHPSSFLPRHGLLVNSASPGDRPRTGFAR